MSIQDNLTEEVKYGKKVAKNLRKSKTYTIRNKDGSSLATADLHYAAHVATAAYKENGYKLFEWYKDYIDFIKLLSEFAVKFSKDFKTVYYSKAFTSTGNTNEIKKIGDIPAAKELYELWTPMIDYSVLYQDNFSWYKKWLKEMTYDDAAFISPLNSRQLHNNKIAYSDTKKDLQKLCTKNNTEAKDYIINKELTSAKVDGLLNVVGIENAGKKDIMPGEEDPSDE